MARSEHEPERHQANLWRESSAHSAVSVNQPMRGAFDGHAYTHATQLADGQATATRATRQRQEHE